jgi:hypothetical protein
MGFWLAGKSCCLILIPRFGVSVGVFVNWKNLFLDVEILCVL